MFYHQKVARVRVFTDIQNFALRAWHCQKLCESVPVGEAIKNQQFEAVGPWTACVTTNNYGVSASVWSAWVARRRVVRAQGTTILYKL